MNKYLEKVERMILKTIRTIIYRDQLPDSFRVDLSRQELNDSIYDGLSSNQPLMVCRFGSTEFENFSYEYAMRQSIWKRYLWYIKGWLPRCHRSVEFEQYLMSELYTCSGFFPYDSASISRFTDLVLEDMSQIDILGVWRQENIFLQLTAKTGAMDALEPYDYENPWSKALLGKRVLVIHPFAETIKKQYAKRARLWQDPNVLPEFELKTIKAVQTLAGEPCEYKDWFEALDAMKRQMDEVDYDIAIIGCGAYGFHLAAHAKRKGKKAVHLGGATQILFGIKGKRWDENPEVNKFYNDAWVYPSADETPKNKNKVEQGCYW